MDSSVAVRLYVARAHGVSFSTHLCGWYKCLSGRVRVRGRACVEAQELVHTYFLASIKATWSPCGTRVRVQVNTAITKSVRVHTTGTTNLEVGEGDHHDDQDDGVEPPPARKSGILERNSITHLKYERGIGLGMATAA